MTTESGENFREMELWEHLSELRTRLIRAVIWLALGMSIAWYFYPWIETLVRAPMDPIMKARNWQWVYKSFQDAFLLRLQVSLVAGLIFAIPAITLEVWGFVAPGLTRNERKACAVVFPASIFFFLGGVICGYFLMGTTVGYFAQFISSDTTLLQDPIPYLTFMVKMVVAFGICFQMPLILMFLCWVGMVTSKALVGAWRYAMVGCFAVAAIATPGGDPMTMAIMAAPLAVLYFASIFLCGLVEKVRRRDRDNSDDRD
jgi:sec-independent protein translocase protein TatC